MSEMKKEKIIKLKNKIKQSIISDREANAKIVTDVVVDNSNWRNRWRAEIYLLENDISYENYEGSQNALLIREYIFYPPTNKWRVKGKNVHYRSKGIEDLWKRFILGEKK